jgi:hypothetical protein
VIGARARCHARRTGLLVSALTGLAATPVLAQQRPAAPQRLRASIRADAIVDHDPGAQLGVGLFTRSAYNVRTGLDLGAGGVSRDGTWRGTGRADLIARWLSDPFRQGRWAVHAGGGVGLRVERQAVPQTVALVMIGVERRGDRDASWVPGVELGLGGGVRLGVTLRQDAFRRR